jgi:5-hydroxyisourate hydrolase
MSQITTHVLDTSLGQPAEGIQILLQQMIGKDVWETLSAGKTNSDGRQTSLLPEGRVLASGVYRLLFETAEYFGRAKVKSFYPFVSVVFEISGGSHYHVPLLLSPFGYSTYRGS